jgi:RNA polymerase sigma-70 factor (ECF subfamily)
VQRLARTLIAVPIQPDTQRLDVRRALQRLRPIDAEIITLAVWEGFTSPEIGTMLGLPAETVRTRMRRARARLRSDLGLDLDGVAVGVIDRAGPSAGSVLDHGRARVSGPPPTRA